MRDANRLIQDRTEIDSRLTCVDVRTPMIGADGLPRPDLLVDDGLHLSAARYTLWTRILRPPTSRCEASVRSRRPLQELPDRLVERACLLRSTAP